MLLTLVAGKTGISVSVATQLTDGISIAQIEVSLSNLAFAQSTEELDCNAKIITERKKTDNMLSNFFIKVQN